MKMKDKKARVIYWILGIFLGLALIAGSFIYINFFKPSPLATLVIEQGSAQYKTEAGEWKKASNGMTLKQDYSIKTLESSIAKIIFSDSVMRMDEKTEVRLDSLSQESVSLTQAIGRTWSRLLKISGISDYEVNTPNAIASVRGTGFAVAYDGKDTQIKVAEGNVKVDSYDSEKKQKIASIMVNESKEAMIKEKMLDKIEEKDLTEDDWIISNKRLDEQHKKEIKERLLKKYGFMINYAKRKNNMSDEQVDELLEKWLNGEVSVKKSIESGEIPEDIAKIIPAELKRA